MRLRSTCRRWRRWMRYDCSLSARVSPRTSPSRACVTRSTTCHLPSSSRRRARPSCRRRRTSHASAAGSISFADHATWTHASRRCARPSTGATSCSTTPSIASSPAWPSSQAGAPLRRRRRSPVRISTRSRHSYTRVSCATPPSGSGCSRRSASTRWNDSRITRARLPFATGTPTGSWLWPSRRRHVCRPPIRRSGSIASSRSTRTCARRCAMNRAARAPPGSSPRCGSSG